MGQALYRKYRSKSLSEVVGQDHITETLRHAIKSGRISHAYLFTGPRGVGKTSIARILAHELNGVPYTNDISYLDIIEIDAASNNGVDEVRDLREKVHIAPSSGKYKVYIIDEVHMMTPAAFNALLKTLEEPPPHAIFILATTEAHKLPATIISRTQRYTFKPVPTDKAIQHLKSIAGKEKIDISDEAIELIAELSEGSFRDSIGMLDQAGNYGKRIDRTDVEVMLGVPSAGSAVKINDLVCSHDMQGLVAYLHELSATGYQASAIAKTLSKFLREQLLGGRSIFPKSQTLTLLSNLLAVPSSPQSYQMLEIVLLEASISTSTELQEVLPNNTIFEKDRTAPPVVLATLPYSEPAPKTVTDNLIATDSPEDIARPKDAGLQSVVAGEAAVTESIDDVVWQSVLASLRKQYNTLYGIIRMARPEFLPGRVRLTFGFAFHQKRANDSKNKQLLMAVLENISGQKLAIECLFDKTVTPPAPSSPSVAVNPVSASSVGSAVEAINKVFGGGEIL